MISSFEKPSLLLQRSFMLLSSGVGHRSSISRSRRLNLNRSDVRNFSTKGGKNVNQTKRPRLSDNKSLKNNLDGVWYSTNKPLSSKNLDMGKYGLKRLDYNTIEVPVWTVPPHPP